MKTFFGGACALLHIGACVAVIGPSLITVDEEVLENKLSESDPSREIDSAGNNKLCRKEGALGDIDPDVDEDSKLTVVRLMLIGRDIEFDFNKRGICSPISSRG